MALLFLLLAKYLGFYLGLMLVTMKELFNIIIVYKSKREPISGDKRTNTGKGIEDEIGFTHQTYMLWVAT